MAHLSLKEVVLGWTRLIIRCLVGHWFWHLVLLLCFVWSERESFKYQFMFLIVLGLFRLYISSQVTFGNLYSLWNLYT